jgi:hypothetical protein
MASVAQAVISIPRLNLAIVFAIQMRLAMELARRTASTQIETEFHMRITSKVFGMIPEIAICVNTNPNATRNTIPPRFRRIC